MFSGVTDCYQPLEAAWKLTQGCLEVCLAYRNPVAIVTKSMLIRRDAQLLAQLAKEAEASVSLSIPFFDEETARLIEPGAPTIRRRFETMEVLAKAGIPVGIGVAPVIPGLNDTEIPGLLQEAKRRGARFAFHTLLRLPGSVKEVFFHRLKEVLPLRAPQTASFFWGCTGIARIGSTARREPGREGGTTDHPPPAGLAAGCFPLLAYDRTRPPCTILCAIAY